MSFSPPGRPPLPNEEEGPYTKWRRELDEFVRRNPIYAGPVYRPDRVIPDLPPDWVSPLDRKEMEEKELRQERKQRRKLRRQNKQKRLQEKQIQQHRKTVIKNAEEEAKKRKPDNDSSKGKDKPAKNRVSVDFHLESLDNLKPGERKDTSGSMPDAYHPQFVERQWDSWWEAEGFFTPEYKLTKDVCMNEFYSKQQDPFCMITAPASVSGELHLGHAFNYTISDVLCRYNRMRGQVTVFVPGCTDGGVATETVVEQHVYRTEGKRKEELGREEFLKRVNLWKDEKMTQIYSQMRSLGLSLDWGRGPFFTLDDKRKEQVAKAFVTLHDWGYIYRKNEPMNWCCALQTVVITQDVMRMQIRGKTAVSVPGYKEKVDFGVVYRFAYKVIPEKEGEESEEEIVVTTARPELMLGDVAVAVHPSDPNCKQFVGRKVWHPFFPDRELPVVEDKVDGRCYAWAVGLCPAHDAISHRRAKRSGVKDLIVIINRQGVMNPNCAQFSGMKRFECRKAVLEELKKRGLFREELETDLHIIIVCRRTKDVIEPMPLPLWVLNCREELIMTTLTDLADEFSIDEFYPERYKMMWLKNLVKDKDLALSRQFTWGQQIPAYRVIIDGDKEEEEKWVVATSEEGAKEKALEKWPDLKIEKLMQSEDVLDTLFTNAILPYAAWPDPDTRDLYYSPLERFITGRDMMIPWIGPMIMLCCRLRTEVPFVSTFVHSLMLDGRGRKMSSSWGNGVDPLHVIRGISPERLTKRQNKRDYPQGIPECGADALRFTLCASMIKPTADFKFSLETCRIHRRFCEKIWNGVKLALHLFSSSGYRPGNTEESSKFKPSRMERWILSRLNRTTRCLPQALKQYKFRECTALLHNFWQRELCNVYLEYVKCRVALDKRPGGSYHLSGSKTLLLDVLLHCLDCGLRLLHPFMPFLTEELWQRLPVVPPPPYDEHDLSNSLTEEEWNEKHRRSPSICVASYPKPSSQHEKDETLQTEMHLIHQIAKCIRAARGAYFLSNKTECFVVVPPENGGMKVIRLIRDEEETLKALGGCSNVRIVSGVPAKKGSAVMVPWVVGNTCTLYVPVDHKRLDVDKDQTRIEKRMALNQQRIERLEAIISNKRSNRMPENVLQKMKARLPTLKPERDLLQGALQFLKPLHKKTGDQLTDKMNALKFS